MSVPGDRGVSGLQAERTALAWVRTALALLANGVLLLLKDLHRMPEGIGLVAVGCAFVAAAGALLIGRRRQQALLRRPLPHPLTPRLEVHLLGVAVIGLVLVSTFAVTR